MTPTTRAQLDAMFARCARAAKSAGVDTSGWQLHYGSKTNGIAFRLFGGGGSTVTSAGGFLGMTKTDAYNALYYMAEAFDLLYPA